MELGEVIAINLKALRKERNLTISRLSKASGISKAMLSDIEKGAGNPTINTIWKIANGLNIPYTKLMEGIDKETTVVRKTETVAQADEEEHYRVYCYFESTPLRNFDMFCAELDEKAIHTSSGHVVRMQEYIYILQGKMLLHTRTGDYTISEGDALVFDSSLDHSYVNAGAGTLRYIILLYYPN